MPTVPNDSLSPPLDASEQETAQRLQRHVHNLAGLIGPRHMGRPSSMEAATAYIERELTAIGDTVERQPCPADGRSADNLVVERPGTAQRDRIVLLGAHYDTIPETPGADDNASAVAALIEAARLLHGRPSRRTLRFIAFANEEPPHFQTRTMGSQVHARRCRDRGERIVGLVCLEMIGYYSTAPGSQDYPALLPAVVRRRLPRRGDFLGMVGNLRSASLLWRMRNGFRRTTRFPLVALPLPEAVRDIRRSDNGPFWDQGLPAIMVTDTSFFRNPHYHQPGDTAETLDYERLARVTRGIAGGVAHLAGG